MRNSIIVGAAAAVLTLGSSPEIWDIFSNSVKPQNSIPTVKHNHTGAAKLKREARKRRNIRARNKK